MIYRYYRLLKLNVSIVVFVYFEFKKKKIKNKKTRERHKRIYGNGFLSRRKEVKKRLAKVNGLLCQWCKRKFTIEELTIDHIIPASQGGSNTLKNLQLLCRTCHDWKDNMKEDEGKWVF